MSIEELAIYTRKNDSLAFQSLICSQAVQYAVNNGMKQTDVCKELQLKGFKIHRSALHQLKSGKYQRQLSVYTLIAICEACGLNLIDFIKFPEHLKK